MKALVYLENHRYQFPGIRIEVLPTRQYLHDEFASHLIGYLGEVSKKELESGKYNGYQGGDLIGKTGIEKRHEALLRGETLCRGKADGYTSRHERPPRMTNRRL